MEKVRGEGKMGKVKLYTLSTCIWCRKTKEPPEVCPICKAKKERFEKFLI